MTVIMITVMMAMTHGDDDYYYDADKDCGDDDGNDTMAMMIMVVDGIVL